MDPNFAIIVVAEPVAVEQPEVPTNLETGPTGPQQGCIIA
jgi:hypothetical protein